MELLLARLLESPLALLWSFDGSVVEESERDFIGGPDGEIDGALSVQ